MAKEKKRKSEKDTRKEIQAKSILLKVVKFIMKLQRPTEETITIALIPKPMGKDKKPKPYDYAFLLRTHESLDKDTFMLTQFLKRSIFPMLFELVSDIITVEEIQAIYEKEEYTCFYIKFNDPQWKEKIESKVASL